MLVSESALNIMLKPTAESSSSANSAMSNAIPFSFFLRFFIASTPRLLTAHRLPEGGLRTVVQANRGNQRGRRPGPILRIGKPGLRSDYNLDGVDARDRCGISVEVNRQSHWRTAARIGEKNRTTGATVLD